MSSTSSSMRPSPTPSTSSLLPPTKRSASSNPNYADDSDEDVLEEEDEKIKVVTVKQVKTKPAKRVKGGEDSPRVVDVTASRSATLEERKRRNRRKIISSAYCASRSERTRS